MIELEQNTVNSMELACTVLRIKGNQTTKGPTEEVEQYE